MAEQQRQTGTALAARSAAVPEIITTRAAYLDAVQSWHAAKYNVLTPAADFAALPRQWELVPTMVVLDSDPRAGKVYQDRLFCEGDEVAITHVGLLELLHAAGGEWTIQRLDSATVPNYWHYQAVVQFRSFVDAVKRPYVADREYDLRDDSQIIKTIITRAQRKNPPQNPQGQIDAVRLHGAGNAASRALNRAIRKAFSLKQKYTRAEIARPFVLLNMRFEADRSDPMQVQAMLANAYGNQVLLYGGSSQQLLPPTAFPLPTHQPTDDLGQVVTPVEPDEAPVDVVPFEEAVPPPVAEPDPLYEVISVSRSKTTDDFFVDTKDVAKGQHKRFHTSLVDVARACNKARVDQKRIAIEAGVTDHGVTEILEVNVTPNGGAK